MTHDASIADTAGDSQADVDDDAIEATELETGATDDSQPDEAELATDGDGDGDGVEGGETETEGEQSLFRHEFTYKADGQEYAAAIEYDDDGNIMPESLSQLQSTYSKTHGLEGRTQSAVETGKRVQRELDAERLRARQFEAQAKALKDAYDPFVQWARAEPQRAQALTKAGSPAIPDVEKLELQQSNQALLAQQTQAAQGQFKDRLVGALRDTHGLSDEQIVKLDAKLQAGGSYALLNQMDLGEDLYGAFMNHADNAVAKMILDGEISNPQIEAAKAETAKVKKDLKRAKKQKAVRNPLAGGGGGSSVGRTTKAKTWANARTDEEYQDMIKQRLAGLEK